MTPYQYFNLLIILSIHYFVTNIFEKIFAQQYSTESKRPDSGNLRKASTLGMPSGHVETTTILCLILVYYDIMPLSAAILIIIIMALQRVSSERHTVDQTIIGFVIGMLYATIYILTGVSFYSIVILLIINLILIAAIENKVVTKMKNVPIWVDRELLSIIHKKQKDKITNFAEIALSPIHHDRIFYYSYDDLELDLDQFVKKLNSDEIDCVVGIKTGGAILSSYIARKLKKPYYFIRPQNKKFKCNKSDFSLVTRTILYEMHQNSKSDMEMCDIITDDIKNQRILLIDDTIGSGSTMNASIDYLYHEKGVAKVNSYIFRKNSKFDSIINENIHLWSWGFDS